MAKKRSQVHSFDSTEPGDSAALKRLMEKNGAPFVYAEQADGIPILRLTLPHAGLILELSWDQVEILIDTLTAAKEGHEQESAEDGGGEVLRRPAPADIATPGTSPAAWSA
jgi:hypothetical protein